MLRANVRIGPLITRAFLRWAGRRVDLFNFRASTEVVFSFLVLSAGRVTTWNRVVLHRFRSSTNYFREATSFMGAVLVVPRGEKVNRLASQVRAFQCHLRRTVSPRTNCLIRIQHVNVLRGYPISRFKGLPVYRAVTRSGGVFRCLFLPCCVCLGVQGTRGINGSANYHRANAYAVALGRRQVFLMALHYRRGSIIKALGRMRKVFAIRFARFRASLAILVAEGRAPALTFFFRVTAALFTVNVRQQGVLPRVLRQTLRRQVKRGRIFFRVNLFSFVANLAYRGRRFTGRVLSTRVRAKIKFAVPLLLNRARNFAGERINDGLIRSGIRHATRRHLCFRGLIATIR